MARKIIAYPVHDEPIRGLPTDRPTFATRSHFGYGALYGLVTVGSLAATIPVQRPYAGQGLESSVFPLMQPSRVAPNLVRVHIMTAINTFSPQHHSNPLSGQIPAPAVPAGGIAGSNAPSTGAHSWAPGAVHQQKHYRGTGGHGVIPYPPAFPEYPTFIGRMVR